MEVCRRPDGSDWVLGAGSFGVVSDPGSPALFAKTNWELGRSEVLSTFLKGRSRVKQESGLHPDCLMQITE